MNKKKRQYDIDQVIAAAKSWAKCENLHHKKSHQHHDGEFCPATYHLESAIYRIEQILKQGESDGFVKKSQN